MYCRLLLIYTRCDWLKWMEDRETARMRKYGESKTTLIMKATVLHVTSGLGLRKFLADGFLLTQVYQSVTNLESKQHFRAVTLVNKVWFHVYWTIRVKFTTQEEQRKWRNSGWNPNDKQGPKQIGPAFRQRYYGMFGMSHDLRQCRYNLASCPFGHMPCWTLGWMLDYCLKSVWLSPQIVFSCPCFIFYNLLLIPHLLLSTLLTAVFCTRLLVLHMRQLFHYPLSYPSEVSLRLQQL